MKEILFFACCFVLAVVPFVFVCNKVYKDGVFGRMALLGISFAAACFLVERFWLGVRYEVLPLNVMLICAFTVFLVWHLVRFHARVLTTKKAQRGEVERRELQTG